MRIRQMTPWHTLPLFLVLQFGLTEPTRDLPLASNYNTGQTGEGFTPQWQMEMIEQGHQLLLTLPFPGPDARYDDRAKASCGEILQRAAAKRIPISFVCPEWEALLYTDEKYRNLPPEESPLVVGTDGKILDFTVSYPPGKNAGVSPFGVIRWWKDVGTRYTSSEMMRELQKIYPDTPYVVLISNNEARKLPWQEVERSRQYLDLYGPGRSDEFKKKVVGDGYLERYRALVEGLREGLDEWRSRAVIGAYGASPLIHMGIGKGWQHGTLAVPGRAAIEPFFWEAISPSQYITTWNANSDCSVYSPQSEAMNLVVEEQLYRKVRSDLFWEVSVWDAAYRPDTQAVVKPQKWRLEGQSVPPERYAGFVKWVMWIPRARVVRDFRWWHEPRDANADFPGALLSYGQVIAAVDEVQKIPPLARFWKDGTLVPNPAHEHPYAQELLEETKGMARWFLLDCDANPPWPWDLSTPVNVWSFAYVIGKEPEREWLIYAHAPESARTQVNVSVPGCGEIRIDAAQSGSYWHVNERTRTPKCVLAGSPASVRVVTDSPFARGSVETSFAVVDLFHPTGKFAAFEWDFGDGVRATGQKVSHAYAKKGQYVLQFKAVDDSGNTTPRILPVFVDLSPEPGVILRYPLDRSPAGGVFDASGRKNVGELLGGEWLDDPERGTVLRLDGKDDAVHILNTPDINGTTATPCTHRTIRLWLKCTDPARRQVLYEEGGTGAGVNLYVEKGALYGGAWVKAVWDGTWLSGGAIQPDAWHEVSLVLRNAGPTAEADRLELHLDGKKVASGKASQIPYHPGDIHLGRCGTTLFPDGEAKSPGAYFGGCLDDLTITSRAPSE